MTELRRELSLKDLILFNITAGITLRWISYAASSGPFTLTIWILAFLFFFMPLAYVVIDFTRKMPTVILLMSSASATVKDAYLQLTNTTIIVHFIPYVYLFLSHMWMNWKTQKKVFPMLLAIAGLLSTLIAVVLSSLPPVGEANPVKYILIVDGGSLIFVLVSIIFYLNARRKLARG
jgi:hypothetical protein